METKQKDGKRCPGTMSAETLLETAATENRAELGAGPERGFYFSLSMTNLTRSCRALLYFESLSPER